MASPSVSGDVELSRRRQWRRRVITLLSAMLIGICLVLDLAHLLNDVEEVVLLVSAILLLGLSAADKL
jgi:hypothetical protein